MAHPDRKRECQVAISRDLEVARCVLIAMVVLSTQMPQMGGAERDMGSFGRGAQVRWRVGDREVARRALVATSRPRSRSRAVWR